MEEDYASYCLPIFPFGNHYSCSFISLGRWAYFVTYGDRPEWMPKVCVLSLDNAPPARDFVKHLPYSKQDGLRPAGQELQVYAFWTGPDGKPNQIGVYPDETAHRGILFGYAFDAKATPDRANPSMPAYRHPHSFFFSGVPYSKSTPVPNAPAISQNYTDFAAVKPNPARTWAKVASLNPKTLPACHLFDPPAAAH